MGKYVHGILSLSINFVCIKAIHYIPSSSFSAFNHIAGDSNITISFIYIAITPVLLTRGVTDLSYRYATMRVVVTSRRN